LTADQLDNVFVALADETRRAILSRLSSSEARVTDLAAPFDMSLNSVSKHIRILERAGLVSRERAGREHVLRLEPQRLAEATAWLQSRQRFWTERLQRLQVLLDDEAPEPPPPSKGPRRP
jgi:DNA-binding transcriptional ArsR family regulator